MWRRYTGCFIGFVVGALLAWLIGLDDNRVIGVAGLVVAAVVMTFGERWGLVPSADEADKPQTLFSSEPDKPPPPRDTTGYLDSLDIAGELKNDVWEKVGSWTYDRNRKKKKSRAKPPQ
jgi:hypothetical protein